MQISYRLPIIALLSLTFGSELDAAVHPCEQLSENSKLAEIWPDEFTTHVQGLSSKPKGTFQKTADYQKAEIERQSDAASSNPMFAVVSKAHWGDFTYDADREILSLKKDSVHTPKPCGKQEFCSQLGNYSEYDPAGRLKHSRQFHSVDFQISPIEMETIQNREEPLFYYVVSPVYPYVASKSDLDLSVTIHCAALMSDEDGSIKDDNDTLLYVVLPLENSSETGQIDELFRAKGCGELNCDILRTTGWGMARIGSKYSEIQSSIGGEKLDVAVGGGGSIESDDGFWCYVGGSAWPSGIGATLDAKGIVENISINEGSAIRAPNIQTEAGIRIGSSLSDLKKAYPNARPQPEYDGQVDYVYQISSSRKLVFRTFRGSVTSMGIGSEPLAEADGCPAYSPTSQ